MGVMSRRVLPACGNLCFFCPSLRARSRQPVKRYKKFLADIFPRNQEAEPNDRKIGKLCDYASKNPLRIPKITDTLEQRFYKELRHDNFGSVKVVLCIYRKLLSSCKEQMPLFASSLLGIVRTLLDQTSQDEMQILACNILVDFINSQTDSTHMFNLEGIIPKLCQLAQDVGDGERTLRLHSAGLQTLASMVSFMGEHSHISMELDNIISVTLENFIDPQMNPENSKDDQWVLGVLKAEDNESSFPDISNKLSLPSLTTKPELDNTVDTSKSPSYWSRVCLCNMASLAKEATTVRRVLEPLFHNFDANNHWPLEEGVAYPVLIYLQSLLEEAGENSHLLLSCLVKHLDHKNVAKQPLVQIDIVNVITQLGQHAKQEATVTIIGAISDLIKHLRKCLQNSAELSSPGDFIDKQNVDLQFAIEKCISQLSNKQTFLRLSSHQISLLLSSIWVQATSADNMPANFEAMAHSYNIALLYTRSKTSNHTALARCFQLAFSLRSISTDQERGLQPSRRRSLFTLASYMLIFSAKAGNLPELIHIVKASLTEKTADPYLESVEDIRLQTVYLKYDGGKMVYGSEEDEVAASKSLSAVELDNHLLKETLISQFVTKFAKLTEDDLSGIKEQLHQEFSPDDAYPLGAPLFMETPRPCSPLAQIEFQAIEEIMPAASLTDDESVTEANGNLSDRKTSLSVNSLDILSVNELLESVLETAHQVASSQISSTPVPYDQMKSQCEALVTGKQQKMSMLQSFKQIHDAKIFPTGDEKKSASAFNEKVKFLQSDSKLNNKNQIRAPDQLALCSVEYGHSSFRLPPSCPYDKFMKAAGC
ncbi:protein SEMI-ROLLED LEAF 2 isoform X3 [Hevea brasiliensis]|uniref:protein SEMI-ROLLED LEAF 2 isoform X3 n=1 Tax=Hevea brasiliensis TaxID=3981 RepID=UPI0025D7D2F9|nr:protein SEMI-ROLLED LEAF 2 isoform X3 [Hevea brasiliensis]